MKIRSMPRAMALLTLLALAVPTAVRAQEPAGPYRTRVTLAFFAGMQRYKMTDVNDAITFINDTFQSDPGLAALGLKLDPLNGGGGLGGGIRVWPRENILIAADYTRLTGGSSVNIPLTNQPGAPSLKANADLPAQSLGLTVGYFFYRPTAALRVGAGVGGAYYICDGKYEFSFPGFHEKTELHGTGFGAHGMLLGDWRVSEIVHFEAALGYRLAKTTDLESRGVLVLNPDGVTKSKADYTGLITRIGLTIPFGPVK
jgi:hypothetical protein